MKDIKIENQICKVFIFEFWKKQKIKPFKCYKNIFPIIFQKNIWQIKLIFIK